MSKTNRPKFYRLIVKLGKSYFWLKSVYTIPAAAIMRWRYCVLMKNIHAPVVYLEKVEKDFQAVQSLLATSFKILDEKAPVWRKRAGRLFRSFVITNNAKVQVAEFCPHQRCCYFNPWIIAQNRQNMKHPAIPIELASFFVYSTCMAILWERYAQFLNSRDRTILASKARSRFLLRCLDIPKDGSTLAKIRVAETQQDFTNIGITSDDVRANPSILSIIAGIKTVERRVAVARAARKK